jgi:hypothetical protein
MQVQLSEKSEKLIDEYREIVKSRTPTYDASHTSIANSVIESGMTEMIESLRKNHANTKPC